MCRANRLCAKPKDTDLEPSGRSMPHLWIGSFRPSSLKAKRNHVLSGTDTHHVDAHAPATNLVTSDLRAARLRGCDLRVMPRCSPVVGSRISMSLVRGVDRSWELAFVT